MLKSHSRRCYLTLTNQHIDTIATALRGWEEWILKVENKKLNKVKQLVWCLGVCPHVRQRMRQTEVWQNRSRTRPSPAVTGGCDLVLYRLQIGGSFSVGSSSWDWGVLVPIPATSPSQGRYTHSHLEGYFSISITPDGMSSAYGRKPN